MTPLRVTVFLDTPHVQGPSPTHLDSIIAWAAVQDAQVKGTFTSYDDILSKLPLEREERNGEWVWKASYLWPERQFGLVQRHIGRQFWAEGFSELFARGQIQVGRRGEVSTITDVRAPDVLAAASGQHILKDGVAAGAIDTQRGHLKNYSFLYPIVSSPWVTGFCVGDQTEIQRLLQEHLKFFGKRSRLEHGKVSQIEEREEGQPPGSRKRVVSRVNVCEEAQAGWLWEQRALPWPKEGYEPIESPIRPPYWQYEKSQIAYRPTEFVTLDI